VPGTPWPYAPKRFAYLRLEEQEPCADRPIPVLEPCRNKAVFHHRQLGAAFGRHRVGRARVPHRIPGAAHSLADRSRAEYVHRAARYEQAALEFVDVELVLAHREAHGGRDPAGVVLVEHQAHDEYAFLDPLHAERLLRGFGDDPLVRLAVDHDLPTARAHRLAALNERLVLVALLLPDRQAPRLEVVHGIVHVTADVVHEVLTRDAHEVVPHVAHVVRGIVFADVGVDRRKSHCDRTRAAERRLVDELDLQVRSLGPARDLERGAAGGHPAADDQNVDFFLDDFRISKTVFSHFLSPSLAPAQRRLARWVAIAVAV